MKLQKIFNLFLPPEEKIFYKFFDEASKNCRDAAEVFLDIVNNGYTEEKVKRAAALKYISSDIAKETLVVLNKTIITPIDREDIQQIASSLNRITKKIVKSAKEFKVYRLEASTPKMKKQAETMLEAAVELQKILGFLRKVSSVNEATESNSRMKAIENKGDDILYEAIDELFSGKYEPLTVMKQSEVYKGIESALNICYMVSDEIVHVIIKHS